MVLALTTLECTGIKVSMQYFNLVTRELQIIMLQAIIQAQADLDILDVTETWLKKSINNSHVSINGDDIYRIDRIGRGAAVAMYSMSKKKLCVYPICYYCA